MRRLHLGPPPNGTVEQKVDWIIQSIKKIETASHDIDAMQVSDSFSVTGVMETRTLDANTGTLANLAAAEAAIDETRDFLLTFIQDLKRRGQKRTG